jgi:hypothetical protein
MKEFIEILTNDQLSFENLPPLGVCDRYAFGTDFIGSLRRWA